MAWIAPKTDWNASDRFGYADYNRIKGNIEYLRELAKEITWPVQIIEMGPDKGLQDAPYADEINLVADNLERVVAAYPLDIGQKTVYEDNGAFIGYADLNRIEGGCLNLYQNINRIISGRRRISFRLGGRRVPFC